MDPAAEREQLRTVPAAPAPRAATRPPRRRVQDRAEGDVLAISIPRSETHVIRHFQERMPYGLFST
jgi:hypothetical protein